MDESILQMSHTNGKESGESSRLPTSIATVQMPAVQGNIQVFKSISILGKFIKIGLVAPETTGKNRS